MVMMLWLMTLMLWRGVGVATVAFRLANEAWMVVRTKTHLIPSLSFPSLPSLSSPLPSRGSVPHVTHKLRLPEIVKFASQVTCRISIKCFFFIIFFPPGASEGTWQEVRICKCLNIPRINGVIKPCSSENTQNGGAGEKNNRRTPKAIPTFMHREIGKSGAKIRR